MTIRKRRLPPGWYPERSDEVTAVLDKWESEVDPAEQDRNACAGVAPHAGWAFSGRLAYSAARALRPGADTVAVVGGHLPAGVGILAAFEDSFATPLGRMENDSEMLSLLSKRISLRSDRSVDNTVEIQLPILKYFFPSATLLYLRASPSTESVQLGETICACAEELGRDVRVLGSTDLTHYGPSYGLTDHGHGEAAYEWVTEVNDRALIDALVGLELDHAIHVANRSRAACSVGGAVAAGAFARIKGAETGRLLGYHTSRDVHPAQSFVGYAAIAYPGDLS